MAPPDWYVVVARPEAAPRASASTALVQTTNAETIDAPSPKDHSIAGRRNTTTKFPPTDNTLVHHASPAAWRNNPAANEPLGERAATTLGASHEPSHIEALIGTYSRPVVSGLKPRTRCM